MIHNPFMRLIALFLVPGLLTDPALASIVGAGFHPLPRQSPFTAQALAPREVISSRPANATLPAQLSETLAGRAADPTSTDSFQSLVRQTVNALAIENRAIRDDAWALIVKLTSPSSHEFIFLELWQAAVHVGVLSPAFSTYRALLLQMANDPKAPKSALFRGLTPWADSLASQRISELYAKLRQKLNPPRHSSPYRMKGLIPWIVVLGTLTVLAGSGWSQSTHALSRLPELVRPLGTYIPMVALLMITFLHSFHPRLALADGRRGERLMDWIHQLQNKFMARDHKTLVRHPVKPDLKKPPVKSPLPKPPRRQSFNAPTSYANFSRAFPTVIRQAPRTADQLLAAEPDPAYEPSAALKQLIQGVLIEKLGMKIPKLAARAKVVKADLQTFLNEDPAREFPGRRQAAETCQAILREALANLEDNPIAEILPCPFPIPREMVESLNGMSLRQAIDELFALARAALFPALATQTVQGEKLTLRPEELSRRVLQNLFDPKQKRLLPQFQVFINGIVPSPDAFMLSRPELLQVSLWVDSILRDPAVYALLNRALERAPSPSDGARRSA